MTAVLAAFVLVSSVVSNAGTAGRKEKWLVVDGVDAVPGGKPFPPFVFYNSTAPACTLLVLSLPFVPVHAPCCLLHAYIL